jgi:putative N6-adenine-specific DNA methylase
MTLQVLAIIQEGIEDVTKEEVKEILDVSKVEIGRGFLVFDVKKVEDVVKFCYKAHSVNRVMLLANKLKITDFSKLREVLRKEKLEVPVEISSDSTFAARCYKNDDIETKEIEEVLGGYVHDELKLDVNLNSPDIMFLGFVNADYFYYGVDVSGFDLSKREYKVFISSTALKATVAFALLKIAEWSKDDVLLDPFCGSGEIMIEAALYKAGISPHHFNKSKFLLARMLGLDLEKYDVGHGDTKETIYALDKKFSSVSNAKKNAKIASVVKRIRFSRMDISWLDTKFDKKTVDFIITNPPRIGKFSDQKGIKKVYKELFYQAEFVLREKGRMFIVTTNKDEFSEFAKEYKFKLVNSKKIYSGKQELDVVAFSR